MTFNASETTRTAFNDFLVSVDGYRAAIGEAGGPALAERPAAEGISALFGRFAELIHQRNMRRASAIVRAELARVQEALTAESELTASVRRTTLAHRLALAEALRSAGLANPNPRFDELNALAGAQTAEGAAGVYRSSPRLQQALARYQEWENDQRLAAIEASYRQSLRVLTSLQEQHRKFEAGEPFTLAMLITEVENLRTISAQILGGSGR